MMNAAKRAARRRSVGGTVTAMVAALDGERRWEEEDRGCCEGDANFVHSRIPRKLAPSFD